MRKALQNLIIASAFALAAPSLAQARGLKHTITQPLSTAVKIEVVLSEEMQHRANNLPTNFAIRKSSTRSRNSGFSGNGFYGEDALQTLVESLEGKITRRFTKKGISVSDDAPVTLRVTLEDARNNRPTFRQLSAQPSLSFESVAQGGAKMSADLIDQNGASLGTMTYTYYENDFNRGPISAGIWQDAHRSFDRFARRAAKILTN